MSDVDQIVDELVAARGACAMRDVVARHLSGAEINASAERFVERARIAAKARRHAKVIKTDPEAAAALEDFATLLEREA